MRDESIAASTFLFLWSWAAQSTGCFEADGDSVFQVVGVLCLKLVRRCSNKDRYAFATEIVREFLSVVTNSWVGFATWYFKYGPRNCSKNI